MPEVALARCINIPGRLIDESRSGAVAELRPSELDNKQIARLHQLFHEAKFRDPDGDHLSPAGTKFKFLGQSCKYSAWLYKVQDAQPLQLRSAQGICSTPILSEHEMGTGEYNLRLGITKELNPDMVATHQGMLFQADGSGQIPAKCTPWRLVPDMPDPYWNTALGMLISCCSL